MSAPLEVFNYTLNCAKKSQYHMKPLELSCRCLSLSDFRKNVEDEIGRYDRIYRAWPWAKRKAEGAF